MLNSFYRKFLVVYISIAMVSILAISAMIGYTMQRRTYNNSEKLLQKNADQVLELAMEMLDGTIAAKDFHRQVNLLEKNSDVRVSLIGKHPGTVRANLLPVGEAPERKEWVDRVLNGEKVTVISSFARNNQVRMLIVGLPAVLGDKVIGGIFLYTPIRNIQGLVTQIYRSILFSALCVAVLAVAVLYFVSRHFTRPIIDMSRTAEALAVGDFGKRVPVRGKDELAWLAISLNHMAGKLQRIEAGRKQLISEISHELRTPLTTIRASLQGIDEGVVDDKDAHEYIRISLNETKRLSQLVDDLLQLSSFEEKNADLKLESTDLHELLQQTVTQLTMKAKEKGIGVFLASGDKVRLMADPGKLKQAVMNLVDNALNHCPPGSKVTCRLVSDKNEIRIEIGDNGTGIAPDKLPHIFERFYKVDESRNKAGAGLGLTISRHIVEAHGGSIRAASQPGKGTMFTIAFPNTRVTNL